MKTAWDYTTLAQSCLKRPDYAPSALEDIFRIAGLHADDLVCDIGAGVAHFTLSGTPGDPRRPLSGRLPAT